MEPYHILMVVIGLLTTRISAAPLGTCTDAEVRKCLEPLNSVDYEVGQAVVPYMEEATLRDHCRRYNQFESCMADHKRYCTPVEQLVFIGIEDAYDFLCNDGFDDYLKYRDCFANKNVHSEGDTCNNTLSTSLNKIKHSTESVSYKRDRICQYVKQYLDCVERILESFCSKEAAQWQRTLDEKSLSPLLSGLNCQLDGTSNWIPITIGITLTISILIIIMSVVLICMQKRKRRREAANMQVVGAPPPYDPGPYVVYNEQGATMASGVQQPTEGGALPQKTNLDTAQPPPYDYQNAELQAAPAQSSTSENGAVPSGYFGAAAASGVSVSNQEQKSLEAAEVANMALPEPEKINLPQYEELKPVDDIKGDLGDPEYEDVGPPNRRPNGGFSNPGYM